MEHVLKHSSTLKKSGVFVLPRAIRHNMGSGIKAGHTVNIVLNGENLGEKYLDGDYRIRVGKPLLDSLNDDTKILISGYNSTIEIVTKE